MNDTIKPGPTKCPKCGATFCEVCSARHGAEGSWNRRAMPEAVKALLLNAEALVELLPSAPATDRYRAKCKAVREYYGEGAP